MTAFSRALRTDEVWHNDVLATADSHGRACAEKDKESGEGKTVVAVVNTEQRKLAVIILCDGTNRMGCNT
jgi:hypothetical protein